MILVLGLVILVAAAVVAMAGIFTNTGAAHELTNTFTLFGHHITGSTGTLFLFGVIVGAAAMLGLGLLLTGARRTSRRGAGARCRLRDSRREAAAAVEDRDALTEERDAARVEAAAVAEHRDSLARERDTLAEQRNAITLQRDDLMNGQRGMREQTAGTRTSPMPQDAGTPPGHDETPTGDGHRRPHLLSREADPH